MKQIYKHAYIYIIITVTDTLCFWFFGYVTVGRCGYGSFGATINNGYVADASDLYGDGVGCGACYQVIIIS